MRYQKWLLATGIVLMLVIGGVVVLKFFGNFGHLDVTHDPSYGFSHLVATTWRTKVPLALIDSSGQLTLRVSDEFWVEQHRRAMSDSKYRRGGERVVAILAPGMRITVDQLINLRGTLGFLVVHGVLLDGPFACKDVIEDELFAPNDFSHPGESLPKNWSVDPEKLEKP